MAEQKSTMNPNGRSKMTRQERAKQFMPFAALKGYEDALRLMEEKLEKENNSKNEQIDDYE